MSNSQDGFERSLTGTWIPDLPKRKLSSEEYKKLLREQKCAQCKKQRTKEFHDPCIPNLPGVKFACCGHGEIPGYVMFENGIVLRGAFQHITPSREDAEIIEFIEMQLLARKMNRVLGA